MNNHKYFNINEPRDFILISQSIKAIGIYQKYQSNFNLSKKQAI